MATFSLVCGALFVYYNIANGAFSIYHDYGPEGSAKGLAAVMYLVSVALLFFCGYLLGAGENLIGE